MSSSNPTTTTTTTTTTPTPSVAEATATHERALQAQREETFNKLTYRLSWGMVIICPTLILLPPRKLDFYTLSLTGGFILSANHLRKAHWSTPLHTTPESSGGYFSGGGMPTERARQVQEALAQSRGAEKPRGVLEKAWMGSEGADWREKRLAEERRMREEGKSVLEMIQEHVQEAFGLKPGENNEAEKEGEGKSEEEKKS